MRLFYFFLICFALLIATLFAFCDSNEMLKKELPELKFDESGKENEKLVLSESAQNGKALFVRNCASCHNKNMKDDMTAPALSSVRERWAGREELLYDWIRNSMAVIATKDEYAIKLFEDWNKSVMPPFTNLSNEDIADILAYADAMSSKGVGK